MPVTIITSDGKRHTLEVPEGVDPEDEIERIKNQEGEYASGWLTVRGNTHLRISPPHARTASAPGKTALPNRVARRDSIRWVSQSTNRRGGSSSLRSRLTS